MPINPAHYTASEIAAASERERAHAHSNPFRLIQVAQATGTSSIVGGFLGFAERAAQQIGNFLSPNTPPDLSNLLKLFYGGYLDRNSLNSVLPSYGIASNEAGLFGSYAHLWAGVIEINRPIYSTEFASSLYHQGTLDLVAVQEIARRHGFSDPKAAEKFISQYPPFSVQFIREQRHLGELQDFDSRKEVDRLGYAREGRDMWLLTANEPLNLPLAATLFHRGYIDRTRLENNIRAGGFPTGQISADIASSTYQIPGYADLVRFAVKEVWDEDIVARWGYDREFPVRFKYWMKAQGMDFKPRDVMPNYPFDDDLTWSQAYWRAKWQPISPTQAYTMLHRIRPERLQRYLDQGFNLRDNQGLPKAFSIDDVRAWLKVSDYPPLIRDYLAAISYGPLRLIDIRRALQLNHKRNVDPSLAQRLPQAVFAAIGNYGRDWAIEQLRDRGLHPDDAAAVADVSIAEVADESSKPLASLRRNIVTAVIKDILEQYKLGIVDRPAAEARLVQAGIGQQLATSYLNLEDSKYAKEQVKTFTKWLHREFVMGKYSREEAVQALKGMGIKDLTADNTVLQWLYEFSYRRKVNSTAQIQRWLASGMITFADASLRLFNLGWTQPDIILLMQESQQKIASTQARSLATAERNRAAAAAEIQRNIRRTAAELKEMQRTLRQMTPVSALQRWLKKELVNEPYVRARLSASGYDADSIDKWIRDARNGTTTATSPGTTEGEPGPTEAGS